MDRRISGLPVVDHDGTLMGMISEGDILFRERGVVENSGGPLGWLISPRLFEDAQKLGARVVGEAMTAPVITIGPDRPVMAAAALMIDRGVNRLPVVDHDGRLVGIVTRADLVRAFVRSDAELARGYSRGRRAARDVAVARERGGPGRRWPGDASRSTSRTAVMPSCCRG